MLLTIFTPTYNREGTLPRLYHSLCEQTCKDFEWLVVDDGSTDSTESLVREFEKESDFPIIYIKKDNGGKHTAHNLGLQYATGAYFFTVDSDDWLPEGALRRLKAVIDKLRSGGFPNTAGILGLKSYGNGETIGAKFSNSDICTSLSSLEQSGEGGERSIILETAIARKFTFPIIDAEKFMPECVIYDKIGQILPFFIVNEVFTSCEYQCDGLSSNPQRLMALNPGGYMMYYSQRIDITKSFKERIRYAVRYNAFRFIYSGQNPIVRYHGHKLLYFITAPLGWIASRYYLSFC